MDFVLSESDSEPGPSLPSLAPEVSLPTKPSLTFTSRIKPIQISTQEFKKQLYTYENYGYANNPLNPQEIIVIRAPPSSEYKSVFQKSSSEKQNFRKELKSLRIKNDDPASNDFKGPWARYQGEEDIINGRNQELTEEQKVKLDKMRQNKERWEETQKPPGKIDYEKTDLIINEPSLTRHIDLAPDYQGRNVFVPPSDLKQDPNSTSYLPKKCFKTLAGHTKEVECVKFHKDGHLLLSCSLDNTVKIWDVANTKKCIQTYSGHTNSVRDISWSLDCTSFLSSSLDRLIRQWDTETGKVICTFTCRRIPYCVRFNPNPERQSSFLAGTSNKRIVEYDTNSGRKERIYEEHLGSINSLCFCDDNRRFISTSDDKKIYLWDFGIPLVNKHISDPNLHSVPYTVLHPNTRHFVGQCLDNKLVVFEAKGGFRLNRRKKFVGHMNGGYGCAVVFSPDGQFVSCGDVNGRIWFWDWKTTKNYRMLQAHENVVIGMDWHPIWPSTLATCSWDGMIKLWD